MKFKDIYLFQIFDCLSECEVYLLDKVALQVHKVSEMQAGLLSKIVNDNNGNRYSAWIKAIEAGDENVQ
mgnify:CR=1 FL=1